MKPPSPLAGRRIVVTRTRDQASELAERLQGLGAEVLELPVIRVAKSVDLQTFADVMVELGSYDWIVFTSANGVRHFFEEFFRVCDDIRALGLLRVAAVGESTALAVAQLHLKIECQPRVATAEALADALIDTGALDNAKVLVITGSLNRDLLVKKLETAGAIVDRLPVYQTTKTDLTGDPAAADYRARGADAVLFASSSSVDSFVGQAAALALEPGARKPLFGSIGPQTSASIKAAGLKLDFEAAKPGIDELVAALVRKLSAP
jgi:uroporphyrinogen-III synthase